MADNPFDPPEHHGGGGGSAKPKGTLTQKMGGVPVWGWGAGISVLIILIVIYRQRKAVSAASTSAADTTAATDTTATSDNASANLAYDDPNQIDPNTDVTYASEGYATPTAVDSYLAGSSGGTSTTVGLTPQGLPGPTTNVQWASLVADYLIGKGDDPTLVSNALAAYTQGGPLSAAEQAIVNVGLQTFGEPPEGVVPVDTTPAPVATPVPPPITIPKPGGPTPTPPPAGLKTVPEVTGETGENARDKIAKAGLTALQTPATTPKGKTTRVKSQNPKAGKHVPAGSPVAIEVEVT